LEQGEAGPWLVNLRLPGIGVTDEPRIRAWVQFHTAHTVGREIFQGTIFQCGSYQALFQHVLLRHELPLDLTAVAMVASGCLSDIESSTGARGLWQFSPVAARAYHLRVVPEVIDERLNPSKATEAAVRLLGDLRRKMGSWELAAASFGMGPFELLLRLVQAGDKVDFWQLANADPLVADTAAFVSKVQAYSLILSNLDRFRFEAALPQAPEETFELEVPSGTPLGLVARAAGTSTAKVRELNPEILGHKVPDDQAGDFVVAVPKASGRRAREKLAALIAEADGADQCVPHNFDWGRQRFTRAMANRCYEARR
jgi:membrane-bound lytic murein transglycosylase D